MVREDHDKELLGGGADLGRGLGVSAAAQPIANLCKAPRKHHELRGAAQRWLPATHHLLGLRQGNYKPTSVVQSLWKALRPAMLAWPWRRCAPATPRWKAQDDVLGEGLRLVGESVFGCSVVGCQLVERQGCCHLCVIISCTKVHLIIASPAWSAWAPQSFALSDSNHSLMRFGCNTRD
eukprot:1594734-Amphidinium_carterae.1